ncbi:MAG: periplasmic heavy metal sensor [Acidobacteria bacterium]|nr:periplasmic heavy metal sensor [Acidobacteriota bacterium]
MIRRTFIWTANGVLLLWFVLLFAGIAQAQEGHNLGLPQLPGKWWKMQRVVQEADLTPQQVERIEAIFLEHRKNLIDLKASLEKAQLDFKALVEKDDIDREAVMAALTEISRFRAEIIKMTVVMQLDINEVLTPEQRATLKRMRKEFRLQRQERLERKR